MKKLTRLWYEWRYITVYNYNYNIQLFHRPGVFDNVMWCKSWKISLHPEKPHQGDRYTSTLVGLARIDECRLGRAGMWMGLRSPSSLNLIPMWPSNLLSILPPLPRHMKRRLIHHAPPPPSVFFYELFFFKKLQQSAVSVSNVNHQLNFSDMSRDQNQIVDWLNQSMLTLKQPAYSKMCGKNFGWPLKRENHGTHGSRTYRGLGLWRVQAETCTQLVRCNCIWSLIHSIRFCVDSQQHSCEAS